MQRWILTNMAKKSRWLQFGWQAALSCILTFVVAACVVQMPEGSKSGGTGSTVSDTSATGGATGAITVYTALEDDQLAKYLPLFQKEHPDIKVNKVRDSTGVVIAKLLAEKDNPQADVVWGLAVSSLLVADQQGMLEPYAPKGLENVRPKFKDDRTPPRWVGIDAWMSAFCVNTAEVNYPALPDDEDGALSQISPTLLRDNCPSKVQAILGVSGRLTDCLSAAIFLAVLISASCSNLQLPHSKDLPLRYDLPLTGWT